MVTGSSIQGFFRSPNLRQNHPYVGLKPSFTPKPLGSSQSTGREQQPPKSYTSHAKKSTYPLKCFIPETNLKHSCNQPAKGSTETDARRDDCGSKPCTPGEHQIGANGCSSTPKWDRHRLRNPWPNDPSPRGFQVSGRR